jgi:hypothetical protein
MTKDNERKNLYSFHLGVPFLSYPGSISNNNSVQGDRGVIKIGCYEAPSRELKDSYAPRTTKQRNPTNTNPKQSQTTPKKKTSTPRKRNDSKKQPYKTDCKQEQPSYACLFYNSNIVQGKGSSNDIC